MSSLSLPGSGNRSLKRGRPPKSPSKLLRVPLEHYNDVLMIRDALIGIRAEKGSGLPLEACLGILCSLLEDCGKKEADLRRRLDL